MKLCYFEGGNERETLIGKDGRIFKKKKFECIIDDLSWLGYNVAMFVMWFVVEVGV